MPRTELSRVLIATWLACVGCGYAEPAATDAGGDTKGDAGTDSAAAVTYTKDIQPIFMVKCATCHTTQGLGNHNIGASYADTQKDAEALDFPACWDDPDNLTMPKKVGECALILIKGGQMPLSAGCSASPPLEPDACLTPDQVSKVEAWVMAGMPE